MHESDTSRDPACDAETGKPAPNRRSFLRGIGAAGAAGVAASLAPPPLHAADDAPAPSSASSSESGNGRTNGSPQAGRKTDKNDSLVAITLSVNGKKQEVRIDPRASLLDTLRETMDMTGTKKGCDHGQCGACTVHIDGKRELSCLSLAMACQGRKITTIEGLGTPEKMHPMQAAFVACDGFQCGYCTSGQIMSAAALLKEPVGPEDADVKEAMSGNICRCGAYANIVEAIQQVRKG